jgi:heme oxygenase
VQGQTRGKKAADSGSGFVPKKDSTLVSPVSVAEGITVECLAELRRATRGWHQALEALPLSQRLAQGSISLAEYTALLADMYHVYHAWEVIGQAALAAAGYPWPVLSSRAAAIARDLAFWQFELPLTPPCPQQLWVSQIEALPAAPAAWAGVGYVLEGSRLGSQLIGKALAKAWNCPERLGHGLDYHLEAAQQLSHYWPKVTGYLERIGEHPESRQALLSAAVATFELFYQLHAGPQQEAELLTRVAATSQEGTP